MAWARRDGGLIHYNWAYAHDDPRYDATTSLSLVAFVYVFGKLGADPKILTKSPTGDTGGGPTCAYALGLDDGALLNQKLVFTLDLAGTETILTATTPIPEGRWVHVAAVYTGSAMNLYQDGVLVGTRAATGAIIVDPSSLAAPTAAPTALGNDVFTFTYHGDLPVGDTYWQGAIGKLGILKNVALSIDDIHDIACGSADPRDFGDVNSVTYWLLDDPGFGNFRQDEDLVDGQVMTMYENSLFFDVSMEPTPTIDCETPPGEEPEASVGRPAGCGATFTPNPCPPQCPDPPAALAPHIAATVITQAAFMAPLFILGLGVDTSRSGTTSPARASRCGPTFTVETCAQEVA